MPARISKHQHPILSKGIHIPSYFGSGPEYHQEAIAFDIFKPKSDIPCN